MKPLNSNSFLQAWISTVESKKEILQNDWRNAKAFTTLVKGCEDSIMTEVAKQLELKCYAKDYYSIDTILYDDEDLVPGIPEKSFWFRQIKVAFEHENFFGAGLYQEVAHLLLINSDLKVLVTYPSGDETDRMEKLHSIIKGCNQQKVLSDRENFLVILGYETNFQWEAFAYKEDKWNKIM